MTRLKRVKSAAQRRRDQAITELTALLRARSSELAKVEAALQAKTKEFETVKRLADNRQEEILKLQQKNGELSHGIACLQTAKEILVTREASVEAARQVEAQLQHLYAALRAKDDEIVRVCMLYKNQELEINLLRAKAERSQTEKLFKISKH